MGKSWGALFLTGFLLGVVSCGNTVDAIDGYLDARDQRAAAFCDCFGPLIDYVDDDGNYGDREFEDCLDGEQLESHQRSCITSMYTTELDYPPDAAFDCLADVEREYAKCIKKLRCDDISGLESCIGAYNFNRNECPRMSANDESNFEKCTRA